MINLSPYAEDCCEFHRNVIFRKLNKRNDPTYKSRLNSLNDRIEKIFERYAELIDVDDLKSIKPFGFNGQEKTDLLSLYRFKSQSLQKLLVSLTTKGGRKFNICQMCTVEPVGSFDHIVPKQDFPEFVVNPKNLFPVCLTCNDKKGSRWVYNGERIFLNLYYDVLPDVGYLKIEFKTFPIPIFYIDPSLDEDFFLLIKSHYENLELLKRFRESSNEVIDQLVTEGRKIVAKIGLTEFRAIIGESTREMQLIYGNNHWKSLLKLEIVNHIDFESLLR